MNMLNILFSTGQISSKYIFSTNNVIINHVHIIKVNIQYYVYGYYHDSPLPLHTTDNIWFGGQQRIIQKCKQIGTALQISVTAIKKY